MTSYPHSALPPPSRERWQPLRLGIVDLFYYDAEEIHFRDGRVLLRGNNGTGKSKIMALTLPFLLDGRLSPTRIEPDGDAKKRMEWNLLLGGKYDDRQGYTWLELGRTTETGAEYVTIGCGLRAVAGRPVRSWFFTTSHRVGVSLFLVSSGRTISKDRLEAALGDRGQVYDQASTYRRAIDERLFRLGADRYEALIGLLLQLRQPQLSKRPNPEMLSRALTQALQPLDQAVLADVAEAFRNLEAERNGLEALIEAGQSVGQFLQHYRQYAAIACKRRGRGVRTSHSRYEEVRAKIGKDRAERERAARQREQVEADLERIARRLDELRGEELALHRSRAMDSAKALHNAADAATSKRELAGQRAQLVDDAKGRTKSLEQDLQACVRDATERAGELADLISELAHQAEAAAMAAWHGRALAELSPLEDGSHAPEEIGNRFVALWEFRARGVRHVESKLREVAEAERVAARAQDRWNDASEEAERLAIEHGEAREATEACAIALVEAYTRYFLDLEAIELDDPESAAAELEHWCRALEGENPAALALQAARSAREQQLAREDAALDGKLAELHAERDRLEAERAALEAGVHTPPPAPASRQDGIRDGRPGAPLWQLVDFRQEVPAGQRGKIEAALEAAGLLDAWVLPEGDLLDPETWDTLIEPLDVHEKPEAVSGTLAEVLQISDERASAGAKRVDDAIIRRILLSVEWGPSVDLDRPSSLSARPAQIDRRGRWRLGPARGAWHKDEPQHIGHSAREAERRRRLADIAESLAAIASGERGLVADRARIREARARIEKEYRARPNDRAISDAHAHEAACARACRKHDERVEETATALRAAEERAAEARRARDEAAADLALPADEEQLARISSALVEYRAGAIHLPRQVRDVRTAKSQQANREARLAETQRELSERQRERASAERDADNAEHEWLVLKESVGAEVEELQQKLSDLKSLRIELGDRQEGLGQERDRLVALAGKLDATIQAAERELHEQSEKRYAAIEHFRAFVGEGLLRVAAPEVAATATDIPWTPEPTVRLARAVDQALAKVDDGDGAWTRHQRELHNHFTTLAAALSRHGHDASVEQRDDLLLVRIVFQSRRCDPDELAERLDGQIKERQDVLDHKERELLETYLIDEVAAHLQQMISAADRQVADMNEEIEKRPTSTGMRLRLSWRPLDEGEQIDGVTAPAGLAEVRKRLLRQVADAWSPADRRLVGEFLQRRIQAARDADEGGSLVEILERALDYRVWHRFVVQRWQGGRWQPAYGPASGGERALAITIPLFAAAASHYRSAGPAAPRMIMLDEVFAGIDDRARASCMGLLAEFDLDVMMTSEREWGCYTEVPGLSIANLVRRDDLDAVFVTRWSWDGRRRQRDTSELPPVEPEAAPSPADEGQEELF